MTTDSGPSDSIRRDIVLTRTIDAPVESVWDAWTDPDRIAGWWGPTGFTSPWCKVDLRVGGRYVLAMRSPDFMGGRELYTSGTYTAIAHPDRLEFTQWLSDEDGDGIDPATLGFPPDFPPEITTTVRFESVGEETRLTVTESDWPVGPMLEMSELGLGQTLDKLVAMLGSGSTRVGN
jgi:uncharacterized protein YndB with AHSA1/START domain